MILGVLFDGKLSLNQHNETIVNSALKMYGCDMRSSTEFKRISTYLYLYKTLIRSQLEYTVLIWKKYLQSRIRGVQRPCRLCTHVAVVVRLVCINETA